MEQSIQQWTPPESRLVGEVTLRTRREWLLIPVLGPIAGLVTRWRERKSPAPPRPLSLRHQPAQHPSGRLDVLDKLPERPKLRREAKL